MEREPLDNHLAHALKKELLLSCPPANGKARLLSDAAHWQDMANSAWPLFPRHTENLYRIHVYQGVGFSERLDCLMAACSLEFGIFNQQHQFS
jgi:hypothetical protein